MQEVFERIIDQLKAESVIVDDDAGNRAVEIIEQAAEEFGRDTNVGSNGWIPCSVSMPVFGKRYLVTGVWKDKEYENYRVYDAVYGSDGIWHGNYYEPVGYEVISWQPLPEPYQPKGE